MKQLIYLPLLACLVLTACGDAGEPKEIASPVEEAVETQTDKTADAAPESETAKDQFPDVTPEMMVAFKRFREAVLNRDAVRLGSLMNTDKLENGCAYEGDRTVDAAGLIALLDEAQLEVLKKRIETTVNTDTKHDGCVYKDFFNVDEDKTGFSWSVGCIQLLEEEIGEYNTIFQFRKVGGKYRLTGVMCAG